MAVNPRETGGVPRIQEALDLAPALLREVKPGKASTLIDGMKVPGVNDYQGHLDYFAAVLGDPAVDALLPFERKATDGHGIWILQQSFTHQGTDLSLEISLAREEFIDLRHRLPIIPEFRLSVGTPPGKLVTIYPETQRAAHLAMENVKDRFLSPSGEPIKWRFGLSSAGWMKDTRKMIGRDFASTPEDPINRGSMTDTFYARIIALMTSARNLNRRPN